MDTVWITGVSGSRKSSLANLLTKTISKERRLVVSNKTFPSSTKVLLDDALISKLSKGCAVIIDDWVCPTKQEVALVKRILVEQARLLELKVVVITHSITGNNIVSLAPFFQRIIITYNPANKLLLQQASQVFKLDKSTCVKQWRTFMKGSGIGAYLIINDEREFEILTPAENEAVNAASEQLSDEVAKNSGHDDGCKEKRKRIMQTLATQERCEAMECLFDFLIDSKVLSYNQIDQDDLSVTLTNSTKQISCAVVDLLWHVTRQSTSPPPQGTISLFKYLCQHVTIPTMFVRNSFLLKIQATTAKKP